MRPMAEHEGLHPYLPPGAARNDPLPSPLHAGVPARVRRYSGMLHGFMLMAGVLDDGARAIAEVSAALREELGAAPAARS